MKKLVQDDSSHWYIIDEQDEELFEKWVQYYEDEGPVQLEPHEKDFEDCLVDGPHRIYFESYEER